MSSGLVDIIFEIEEVKKELSFSQKKEKKKKKKRVELFINKRIEQRPTIYIYIYSGHFSPFI